MAGELWTQEAVAECRRLYEAGRTAGQIVLALKASGFGNRTRNSVIGVLHRANVKRERILKPSVPRQRKPRPIPPRPLSAAPSLVPVSIDDALARIEQWIGERKSVDFYDLESNHCRAPLTERGQNGIYKFCGRTTADDGAPYCPEHSRLFYQPREAVRRRHG